MAVGVGSQSLAEAPALQTASREGCCWKNQAGLIFLQAVMGSIELLLGESAWTARTSQGKRFSAHHQLERTLNHATRCGSLWLPEASNQEYIWFCGMEVRSTFIDETRGIEFCVRNQQRGCGPKLGSWLDFLKLDVQPPSLWLMSWSLEPLRFKVNLLNGPLLKPPTGPQALSLGQASIHRSYILDKGDGSCREAAD